MKTKLDPKARLEPGVTKTPTKRSDTVLAVKLHAIGALTTCSGTPPTVMDGTPEWSQEYGAVRDLVILRNTYQEQIAPASRAVIAEVRCLREEVRILRSQVRVMELFGAALHARTDDGQPMGEDPAWRLEQLTTTEARR